MKQETEIVVERDLPLLRITREFEAPCASLYRAHVDPRLFVEWIGPSDMTTLIDYWDARTGGSWRYVAKRGDAEFAFRGCFHELRENELVIQTQTYEGSPDSVSLDRMTLVPLGERRSRLVCTSLHESYAARDTLISSGMERGLREGHERLASMLAIGLTPPTDARAAAQTERTDPR
jgi:uncharacterized protein YndB with AHSA1/START domain